MMPTHRRSPNDDTTFTPDPPQKVAFYQVAILFVYHILLALFLAYTIYNVWPPQPWPGDSAQARAEDKAREQAEAKKAASQANAAGQNQNASVAGTTGANANAGSATNTNARGNSNTAANTNAAAPANQNSNSAGAGNVNAAPPQGSESAANSAEPSTAVYGGERPPPFWLFGYKFQPTLEVRLLLLVLFAGAIGSYIHASSSFVDYLGNRTLISSWVWWYLLRPFIGMMLALLFYFVFRGGFITAGVNQGGEAAASFINPFGIAALAGLVGMFSKVASDKLNEVFLTLFAPKAGEGDAKRGDKLSAGISPVITAVTPNSGPKDGGTPITITGTDFLDGVTVNVGGVAASSVFFSSATKLTAVTPPHAPGIVDIEVTSPNRLRSVLTGGFTYVLESAGAAAGFADSEQDVDAIDGCDVDIINETPDEDLPPTEGGVA
jgi:hypothetical protein